MDRSQNQPPDRTFAAQHFGGDLPPLPWRTLAWAPTTHDESIPRLIKALGEGGDVADSATKLIKTRGPEAIAFLRDAIHDADIVVRQRVKAILAEFRAAERIEKPSGFKTQFPRQHARLLALLDEPNDAEKTKDRLQTLLAFAQAGSFRKVASAEAKLYGLITSNPDHSAPASRVRRLGEVLGIELTRPAQKPGLKRTELTEAGEALVEWLGLHAWAIQ
jgi:hypothetical protein